MDAAWTLSELVTEATTALARLPAPDNGQIRAVPDERGLRYYTTLGLLDRPAAMRGRTALYSRRHLAQVVAIKRLQTAGKSLAEIQSILATVDDATLARISGITLPKQSRAARVDFWKQAPAPAVPASAAEPIRLSLAPGVELLIAADHLPAHGLTPLEVSALTGAARPLLAELARRGRPPG